MPSTTHSLASTEEIIADMRAGKMVVLVDEEDRDEMGFDGEAAEEEEEEGEKDEFAGEDFEEI